MVDRDRRSLAERAYDFTHAVGKDGLINLDCGDWYAYLCMKQKYGKKTVEKAIKEARQLR